MGTIWYLYKKSFKNKFKKAVKKPITYFYLVLVLFYVVVMPFSFKILLEEFNWQSPDKLVLIFTIMAFWLVPANLISYAKRKGLLFRNCDVHFLFPSPVSPKTVLLYAHIRTLFIYVLVTIIVMLAGIFFFKATLVQVLAYFVVAMILQNMLESSFMLLCYGSEKISEKGKKVFVVLSYLLIAAFVVIAAVKYFQYGLSVETVMNYLFCDEIQMVPIVGWYISTMHLIFMGPTTVNVVCTVLYVLTTLVLFVLAVKMPCSGEFYEDAIKYAEDYQELLQKSKEGKNARLGKKEKYGKAKVTYKGGGAKALFYKQLLEYKKNKLFIFDSQTIVTVICCVVLGFVWGKEMMEFKEFILPLVMGYLVFCTSGLPGKWGQEIKSPYTFLIPDTPMRKLWYATAWEHIKTAVTGVLIAIPMGIMLELPVHQILLSVIFYTCFQACKIYNMVLAEVIVGNVLGKTGKQLFVMLLQGIVIGLVATVAVLGVMAAGMEAGYLMMIGVLVVIAFALMTAANSLFDKMEIME